ncbi:putative inorganic phosphate cotransporter [Aphis craccivora]|uniref:Putative inorganic phosphate cotransporter n=1 Tax=Aphis craccivora TaxID=307492 RepID=A0A6G0YMM0_APHCR|nr:putative inorganic phosphate cotransporter [Aphis craccivora]
MIISNKIIPNTLQCYPNSISNDFINTKIRGKIRGVRYLQSFLLFLCLFAAYLLRVSISVAIVAMTPDKNSTDFLLETHYHIPVFSWTQHTKSLILSAFFWGYLIMNLPAAMIGRRYNNQMLLAMSMTLTVALSLATPILVVAFNWPVLVLIRFLQGLTQLQYLYMGAHWGRQDRELPPPFWAKYIWICITIQIF